MAPRCRHPTDPSPSPVSPDEPGKPSDHPFPGARERTDQLVAVEGHLRGKDLHEPGIIEALPPIASRLIEQFLESSADLRKNVLDEARKLQRDLVGPAPTPIPPGGIPARTSRPLCVIDVGHSPSASGACGSHQGSKICEHAFNTDLAARILPLVKSAEVIVISRDDNKSGYKNLPSKTNALNPDFVISLHANAHNGTASGSEVLHFHTSTQGKKLARILLGEFLSALDLRSRGLKSRTSSDRGGLQLSKTRAPIVIGEPFFIDHPSDLATAVKKTAALARAYATAIDTYAATLSDGRSSVTVTREVAPLTPSATPVTLVHEDLTKKQFLTRNQVALSTLLGGVNAHLITTYGATARPVGDLDFKVLFHCEAGLRPDGRIDIHHAHSLGERGLLPLPANLDYWTGDSAPDPYKPMPLLRNVEQFALYLGAIKNKSIFTLQGLTIYRDLFGKVPADEATQARLLAGIVHGYFYGANYADQKVPYTLLLERYSKKLPTDKVITGTKYVHADTTVITNREANIATALA